MAQFDLTNAEHTIRLLSDRLDRIERLTANMDTERITAFDASGVLVGLGLGIKAGSGTTLSKSAGLIVVSTGSAPSLHNILSSSHDATVAGAVAGDGLRRNAGNTAWERFAIGTAGQKFINSGGLPAWADDNRGPLLFQIGDGVTGITTGVYGEFAVGYACTVTQWSLYSTLPQAGGALQLDLWRTTHAAYDSGATHPVVGDSITGTDKPKIVATGVKGQSSALTGWSTALAKDDIIRINVDSATSIKLALLSIDVKASI